MLMGGAFRITSPRERASVKNSHGRGIPLALILKTNTKKAAERRNKQNKTKIRSDENKRNKIIMKKLQIRKEGERKKMQITQEND